MRRIEIDAIPNQQLSLRLDGSRYDITLKETRGIVSARIMRDDVAVVEFSRCVPGVPLIPYQYLEKGNFMLVTEDGELPDTTKFGATQFLVYLTVAEIESIRATA